MIALLIVLLAGPAYELPANDEFNKWVEKHDVTVYRAETGDADRPWIRATYELPVSASTLEDYICDFDRYEEMFSPAVKKIEVLENGERCHARLHVVYKFPFPFKNRDGIIKYSVERRSDEHFILHWASAHTKGDPSEGIRIEHILGATHITKLPDGTSEMTYEYLGDLGGTFPDWFKEAAWKGEPPHFFAALREGMGLGSIKDAWPKDADAKAKKHWEATSSRPE